MLFKFTIGFEVFPGVYKVKGKIATQNSTPGFRVYGEKTVREGKKEMRMWDPFRSKIGAGIVLKGK